MKLSLAHFTTLTYVVVVGRGYAEDWADVHGSVVHAAFSQGRVLAG